MVSWQENKPAHHKSVQKHSPSRFEPLPYSSLAQQRSKEQSWVYRRRWSVSPKPPQLESPVEQDYLCLPLASISHGTRILHHKSHWVKVNLLICCSRVYTPIRERCRDDWHSLLRENCQTLRAFRLQPDVPLIQMPQDGRFQSAPPCRKSG